MAHILLWILIGAIALWGFGLGLAWCGVVLVGGPLWLVHRAIASYRMYRVGKAQCDADGYRRGRGPHGWEYYAYGSPFYPLPYPYASRGAGGFVSGVSKTCVRRLHTGEVVYCDRRGYRLKKRPRGLRNIDPAEILLSIEQSESVTA